MASSSSTSNSSPCATRGNENDYKIVVASDPRLIALTTQGWKLASSEDVSFQSFEIVGPLKVSLSIKNSIPLTLEKDFTFIGSGSGKARVFGRAIYFIEQIGNISHAMNVGGLKFAQSSSLQ
jgi:hypothetical protein